jgi:hypothetical protein
MARVKSPLGESLWARIHATVPSADTVRADDAYGSVARGPGAFPVSWRGLIL